MSEVVVVGSSGTLACQPWAGNKLVTIVGRLVGLSSDSQLRAGVLDMLNIAAQEFDLAHDWGFREDTAPDITVSATDATYPLPADFKRIYNARLVGTAERTLHPLDRRAYDRYRQGDQDANQTPTHYHLFESFGVGQITLVPTPAASDTLSIRYYRTMPTITDDATDSLCIPYRAVVPIIYKAAALVAGWKSPEISNLWEQKYAAALARCIADDMAHGDDTEGFVPQMAWAQGGVDFTNPNDLDWYQR